MGLVVRYLAILALPDEVCLPSATRQLIILLGYVSGSKDDKGVPRNLRIGSR